MPELKQKNIRFQYDTLVDRHNICNRQVEIAALNKATKKRSRVVLYAPRRYGKTSLVRNVLAPDFLASHKRAGVFFVNFMGVDSLASLTERLRTAVAQLFAEVTPLKSWTTSILQYFKNLRVVMYADPLTGQPSLEIKGGTEHPATTIPELMAAIGKLGKDHPLLLIFDEFQDITLIPEAEALLRSSFQLLTSEAMIMMGSRRELLEKIFGRAKAPFFSFGDDFHLGPIAPADWLPYFNARLESRNLHIDAEALDLILQLMCDVPNAISETGAALMEIPPGTSINPQEVARCLDIFVDRKEQVFRFQISLLSTAEKSVFAEIARCRYVEKISSKAFLKNVSPASSATQKIVARLISNGFLEWEMDKGYRLSDPVLRYFIVRKSI